MLDVLKGVYINFYDIISSLKSSRVVKYVYLTALLEYITYSQNNTT